jgi:hypothetical protein
MTRTQQPNPTATPTHTPTPNPSSTAADTVVVYPNPYYPDTTDLYVLDEMAQGAVSATLKVYTDAFRLIRVVQIRGPVSGPMDVDKANFRDLSMGSYYFIISAESPDGVTKKSSIQNLIILK